MTRVALTISVVLAGTLLARAVLAQPMGRSQPELMRVLDTDRDGKLSASEIENAPAELKKLDRNNDGNLTGAELPRSARQRPGRPVRRGDSIARPAAPLPGDDAEKKILAVLEDMRQNQRRGMANVSREDGRLLRLLTETLGAKHVVEIGTSNGYSAIWFCLALRTTGGRLTTYEISPRKVKLARQNFQRAGVASLVTLVEGDAHEKVTDQKGPIDILFLDADKPGYPDYLKKLLPGVRPGGLILAHNMNYPAPDPDYIKAITTDPALETLFVLKDGAGVGVTLKKR